MALRPKNWDTFQHYRDRRPPWIRLHRSLLDHMEWWQLSGPACKALLVLWLVASDTVDGTIPDELSTLAFRLRLPQESARKVIAELRAAGFLEDITDEPTTKTAAEYSGFGSRYISDKLKTDVWARDRGTCQECGSTERLEYDHIIPVSKGGQSTIDNLQLLCRVCNRKKRNRVKTEQSATQIAAPSAVPRSVGGYAQRTPEERRVETEAKREAETDAPKSAGQAPDSVDSRIACERVGIFNLREQEAVHRMMGAFAPANGMDGEQVIGRIEQRWKEYQEISPQLEWTYGSAYKFLMSGKWDDPRSWPLSKGAKLEAQYTKFLKE